MKTRIEILEERIKYIKEKIDECECGIPSKLWCKDCKRRMKTIKSILKKIEDSIKISKDIHTWIQSQTEKPNFLIFGELE